MVEPLFVCRLVIRAAELWERCHAEDGSEAILQGPIRHRARIYLLISTLPMITLLNLRARDLAVGLFSLFTQRICKPACGVANKKN